MPILDKEMELAESQSIAASAKSQHTLDIGPRNWAGFSAGTDEIEFLITMTEAGAGTGTVTFQTRSSPNADMSGAKVHSQSRAFTASDLALGKRVEFAPEIPYDADRYFDINMVVADTVSAGKVNIIGTTGRQTNR